MNNIKIGVVGEMVVVSKLIEMDFYPSKPYIDDGVDVLLPNGAKIQIKTTNNIQSVLGKRQLNPTRQYRFNLYKHLNKIDYLICHVLGTKDFFIFPKDVIKEIKTVSIQKNYHKKNRYSDYLNNWKVLREHLSS